MKCEIIFKYTKHYCLIFLLLVATSGYAEKKAQDTELKSELILSQDIEAIDVATITVTDQQGNSLSNVKVTESVSKQEYTTDDSGRFTCDLSDEMRYFYAVDKEHKLANSSRLNPDQRKLHIQLVPARVVTGQVVDNDSKPVQGTTVEAIPMGPCALSDNEGNFVIGWLPSWEPSSGICLMARNAERNLAAVLDISRQTENVTIGLIPALTLKGPVTNSEGTPLSGVKVSLCLRKWMWGCFILDRSIYSNDKGRFEIPTLPQLQEYELTTRAENYLEECFTIGQLNKMKDTEEMAPIILHQKQNRANGFEYGQLFINVVDEDCKPIDITEIQLWNAKDHFIADKESFVVTSTDKPGFYRIEEIPTGYYHVISINEEGYAPFQQTDVLIEKNSTNTIQCILPRGDTIEGLVINEQGKPVEGLPVLIKSPLYFRRDVITDQNGRFYADYMPDMRYSVVVEPESESPYETTVFRCDVLCGQKDIKIIVQNKKGIRLVSSLASRKLPGFKGIKINLDTNQTKDKQILICFFDYQQRPSRNYIIRLANQEEAIEQKSLVIIAIQASKTDANTLNIWLKENNISFPVGIIEGDSEKIRFAWGVKSLPWLILTDSKHIVQAEGFGLAELDEKSQQ